LTGSDHRISDSIAIAGVTTAAAAVRKQIIILLKQVALILIRHILEAVCFYLLCRDSNIKKIINYLKYNKLKTLRADRF
jgi:hypothetical protein